MPRPMVKRKGNPQLRSGYIPEIEDDPLCSVDPALAGIQSFLELEPFP